MTFFDIPSPLAQLTEFEVGETFFISANFDEDDTCSESTDAFIKDHDLDTTPVGRSYVDDVATIPTSPDLVDNISPNPLDLFHAFSSGSLPSPSPEYCNMSLINHHDIPKGKVVDC